MSIRSPSCEDCYFRKNLLCAMEIDEPCSTFRPSRPAGVALSPPRSFQRSIAGLGRNPDNRVIDPIGTPPPDRCASALSKACLLLPRDIRDDQTLEWIDEIQCAREKGRPVMRRAFSLALIGIPRLHLQRWLRSLTKGAIR